MIDYSDKLLEVKRLSKRYHDYTLKNNWTRAYEIACDLTEAAQELEDIAMEMANNDGR